MEMIGRSFLVKHETMGAFSYKEAVDALRVKVKARKAKTFAEKLSYAIDKSGKVSLMWGDKQVEFKVK
jgi:hypothetical protein